MLYILVFLVLIIIILEVFKKKKLNKEFFIKNNINKNNPLNVDIQEYKKTMINNDKKKLYKIGLNDNINILEEDCFSKCDKSNCIKFYEKKKILNECLKCNIQKNKCYNRSIIGGNCDDCQIDNIEDKIDCYDVHNFGCPNPKNINYNIGVEPYYFELNDNNINSTFNKKCVFCWKILDNI
jgi:hypothetical protein